MTKLNDMSEWVRQQQLEIVSFTPQYAADFKRLNIEWLEKYFYVEALDHQILSYPEVSILAQGGQIFFALFDHQVVGTCALIKSGDSFELSKMAVTEKYQGLKIGRKLVLKAIEAFTQSACKQLFLESNSRLVPALKLYRQLGFKQMNNPKANYHYQRADVYMLYQP
jgi:ribosomal protein S18 acetylase RimI-like enzyme